MDGVMHRIGSPERKAAEQRVAHVRRTNAIEKADEVLLLVWSAINSHANGCEEQRIDGDEGYLLAEISKARGALAEWRPEKA